MKLIQLVTAAIFSWAPLALAQSAPYAHTQAAGPITTTNATLNGMVVPNGTNTVVWFEWGTNGLYGEATTPVSVGNGTMVVPCTATASNLVMGVLYQCRLVASNDLGVAIGAPRLFAANGDAIAWGYNSYGQTDVYPDGNADLAVAAGLRHTLTLTKDGRVSVVGQFYPSTSTAYVPAGLSNVVAIACGPSHCLAVRSDGTVAAWGADATATNVPAGLSNVIAVAGGQTHSLALRSDGTVVQWGSFYAVPTGLSNIVAIAASSSFNLALRANGRVAAWGNNGNGQLNIPSSLTNVTAIAAGAISGYAAKSDGTVTSWVGVSPPSGLSNVLSIAAGGYHSLALRSDGSVVAWGQNDVGQTNVPVAASNCVAIAAGEKHSVAVSAQLIHPRAAIPWATYVAATNAGLGGFVSPNGLASVAWFEWWERGSLISNSTPAVSVGAGTAVVYRSADIVGLVEGGNYHCRSVISNEVGVVFGSPAAFTTGQKVTAWGDNTYGQASVPTGLSNVVSVAAGWWHGAAIKNDGTLIAWGTDYYGETTFPPEATNVVALAAGDSHTVALRGDGTVLAWGLNTSGEANVPVGLNNVVAIAANNRFSLALKADGTVVVWGALSTYQPTLSNVVSISAAIDTWIAVRENGLAKLLPPYYSLQAGDYVAAVAGKGQAKGLRRDGTISTGYPQPPSDFTNALSLAAGYADAFFGLESAGRVRAWGVNAYGITDVPATLSNAASVVSCFYTTYALGPNVSPIIYATTTNGYVNADLAINLPARDPNGDPITYRVATLPTAGALYQYSAGVRGAAITAPDTAVTDSAGRVIFVPAADGMGTPYATFSYLVNDGLADSPPATVTVNIALPPAPSMASTNSNWSLDLDGAFALTFSGNSNAAYSVYASTNLINWERLGAATQVSNGWFQFLDSAATNWPQRYYRAGAP